jgi:hypothetical protein
VQCFLPSGTIPSHGASPSGIKESSHRHLPLPSPSIPIQPSSSKVGQSSEEHESSDDVDYLQLLKDYCKVQAFVSSTRLKAEILHSELDVARDALEASKNVAFQAQADWAIIKEQSHKMMNLLVELRTRVETLQLCAQAALGSRWQNRGGCIVLSKN